MKTLKLAIPLRLDGYPIGTRFPCTPPFALKTLGWGQQGAKTKLDFMKGKQEVTEALATLFAPVHVLGFLSRFPDGYKWTSIKQAISEFIDYINSLPTVR